MPNDDSVTPRIDDCLRQLADEVRRTGLSHHAHLEMAERQIASLCRELGISLVRATGRVKSLREARRKLRAAIDGTLGAPGSMCAGMDRIAVRVVVESDGDLEVLLNNLKQGMILLKDYVNEPRRDGRILGGDEHDVYRAYHVFTRALTGVPVEIQLLTIQMRRAALRLKRKYGNGYWKSQSFRRGKVNLGDLR